ncbi:hypothetical protein MKY89_27885 [Bacillus sp. FSL W7-1294]|uniref:hypothetical protein n=1 Tax=Bacillus TaxID=1386 RepID=UPI00077A7DD9|nr:hypothetical protein [Bacillus cereus]KXY70693.1 hypothetical protein AT270_27235 [Bacillus cereus]
MKNLIEKLYDETYSPKITPQALLNNLNLPNYSAINYKKEVGFLVAYVSCCLENASQAEYRYYFKDDLLYRLESEIEGVTEVIYDREIEKQKLVAQLKGNTTKQLA